MGLFDWLSGGRPKPEGRDPCPKPPPPKVLAGLEDDSPQLVIDQGNGVVTLMDREMYDYLYGESDAPDPAQRDLDALMPRVTRVRAFAGSMFRDRPMGPEVILDTTDPRALTAFRKALRVVEDPASFTHCGCLGGPTLELFAGEEHVATIGLQHGHSIRWGRWKHDARLVNGQALTDWLTRHGVEPALLDVHYQNQYDAGGLMPVGFRRGGPAVLSRAEQRVRLADLRRVRGGNLDEALTECQQALEAEPGLALGHAVRAFIYHQRGDHARCVADCTEAIQRGLREAELFFTRAVSQDHLGRPQDALADCTTALEIDPGHANALNSRGFMRARQGDLEEGRADLAEAIRLAPQWFLPVLHRAQVHYALGQLDDALGDYDRAIELLKQTPPDQSGPGLALVYCGRGEARFDLFQEEEADADFAEARRRDPATAAEYLGGQAMRRGKFDRAVGEFNQLVRLRPNDPRGYAGRGTCHEALGELDQAVADYTEAIRLQPDAGVAYAMRAGVHHRQGQLDAALADWGQHLRIYPEDVQALLARSALHKQRGAPADALADLEAAHRLAPDNPHVSNNLAWLLATCRDGALRDGRRAVELARAACTATEWHHPFCLGTLGAAYAETGAFDEAIRWQAEALELYPPEEKPAGRERLEQYRARQAWRE
jgi:tetratricopeptide (TPR) repeat protein